MQSEVFIKAEELEARYGKKTIKDTQNDDFRADKARCKRWSRFGGEPFPEDRGNQVFEKISTIRSMISFQVYINKWKSDMAAKRPATLPQDVYDAYSDIWKRIARAADDFSRAYTAAPISDFKFRFFQGPVSPPVELVFSPLVDWIDETELQKLLDDVLQTARANPRLTWPSSFNVKTLSKENADKSTSLITFSCNPMGYFRTLITPSDLTRLVEAQVSPQKSDVWIHGFPDSARVKEADDEMKKPANPPSRIEFTTTSMLFKPSAGKARVRTNRKPTQTIMGGMSANKVLRFVRSVLVLKITPCTYSGR